MNQFYFSPWALTTHLRPLLTLAAVALLSVSAHAQSFPSYSPPPSINHPGMGPQLYLNNRAPDFRKGEGHYQLTDGSWHDGRLVFTGSQLTVKMPGPEKNLQFDATTLQRVVIAADTFEVVGGFTNPATEAEVQADFAQLTLHRGGFEVFTYYHAQAAFSTSQTLLLRRGGRNGEIEVVPRKRKELEAYMAELVADNPNLVARVAKSQYRYQDLPKLISEYVRERSVGKSAGQ